MTANRTTYQTNEIGERDPAVDQLLTEIQDILKYKMDKLTFELAERRSDQDGVTTRIELNLPDGGGYIALKLHKTRKELTA